MQLDTFTGMRYPIVEGTTSGECATRGLAISLLRTSLNSTWTCSLHGSSFALDTSIASV